MGEGGAVGRGRGEGEGRGKGEAGETGEVGGSGCGGIETGAGCVCVWEEGGGVCEGWMCCDIHIRACMMHRVTYICTHAYIQT